MLLKPLAMEAMATTFSRDFQTSRTDNPQVIGFMPTYRVECPLSSYLSEFSNYQWPINLDKVLAANKTLDYETGRKLWANRAKDVIRGN